MAGERENSRPQLCHPMKLSEKLHKIFYAKEVYIFTNKL
jgi:hypothetical protein